MTLGHYSQLAAKVKTAATTSYVVILDPEPYSGTKNDPNKYAEKVKWINDCFQDNSITINQWYLGKCEPNNHNHYVFYAISHLSIYPYNHLYIHLSIYVSDIYSYLSIHTSIHLSIHRYLYCRWTLSIRSISTESHQFDCPSLHSEWWISPQ